MCDDSLDTQIITKKKKHFFSSSIRMSGKNITFDDKKISKSNFCKKQKTIDKILISKKEPMAKKAHSNTFLDIMMSLDLYV